MSERACKWCGETEVERIYETPFGYWQHDNVHACRTALHKQRDRLAAALRALVRHDWLADEREGRPSCAELLEAMETLRVVAPEVPP